MPSLSAHSASSTRSLYDHYISKRRSFESGNDPQLVVHAHPTRNNEPSVQVTLRFISLVKEGQNNYGISIWKNELTKKLVIGKIHVLDGLGDPPQLEVMNAIMMQDMPILSMRCVGVSHKYPIGVMKVDPEITYANGTVRPKTKRFIENGVCTVFYSFEGGTTVRKTVHNILPLCNGLETFLHSFMNVGFTYGFTHNDLHIDNVVLNQEKHFVMIDYGRAHMFTYACESSQRHVDQMEAWIPEYIKTQFNPSHTLSYKKLCEFNIFPLKEAYLFQYMNREIYLNHLFDIATLCTSIYKQVFMKLTDGEKQRMPIRFAEKSKKHGIEKDIEYIDASVPFDMPIIPKYQRVLNVIAVGVRIMYEYVCFAIEYNPSLKSVFKKYNKIDLNFIGVYPYDFQILHQEIKRLFLQKMIDEPLIFAKIFMLDPSTVAQNIRGGDGMSSLRTMSFSQPLKQEHKIQGMNQILSSRGLAIVDKTDVSEKLLNELFHSVDEVKRMKKLLRHKKPTKQTMDCLMKLSKITTEVEFFTMQDTLLANLW
jgi:hypothetical protein